ncbi:MAG: AGE family epimerase/isomerase [Eubacteriales bacterium]|nr:AGE family epimerase/isomerase [Eubacteriales bacterium]
MENLHAVGKEFHHVLMNDFVPFWEKFSPDPVYGGFLCGFDRDGELFMEDKSVWQQGRSLWMFSKLYNEFGHKQSWIDIAQSGYDFINDHCFDEKGHMYFRVTREGLPLVNRRYYFSEAFAIMGYVEFFLATGKEEIRQRAIQLFKRMYHYYTTPGCFPPKVDPKTRSNMGHSIVMIMMNVCQYMRRVDNDPLYNEVIDSCLEKILHYFVREEEHALLETVGSKGERIDSPDGRLVNPGHSLETAWFLMVEAIYRRDTALMEKAMQITLWSLECGWDEKMGGIFYFQDVENKPVLSLEWDMKLLWTHCEGMIACLYSYWYCRDEKYMAWFNRIKDYVFSHYPDPGHPEWFGHLHRDGTPINYIKGSDWKGPFHNVRAFMLITQLVEHIENNDAFFA